MAQQQQQVGNGAANGLQLPPGFRFHPTDEEIITHYLRPKVLNPNFTSLAIGEADLNKSEPWELPSIANMGESEWFFYCQKDRKYPTGQRTNRATCIGYWKATGRDRDIYRATPPTSLLVGMKKTLVFYKGRAPRGEKTNWVMHEYKLPYHDVWVVCRVFYKGSDINDEPELPPSADQQLTMGKNDDNVDLGSTSFPMPTESPMEPKDYAMGSSASTSNSTTGDMESVLPPLPPTVGMDNSNVGSVLPPLPPTVGMGNSGVGSVLLPLPPMVGMNNVNTGSVLPPLPPAVGMGNINVGSVLPPLPPTVGMDNSDVVSMLPPLPPTVGMDNIGLQMHTIGHFGDMLGTADPAISFYQQGGIGTSGNSSFMVEPHNCLATTARPVGTVPRDMDSIF